MRFQHPFWLICRIFWGHSRETDKVQIGFQTNPNKPITNHNNATPINATKPLNFSDFVSVCYKFVTVCLYQPKLSYTILSPIDYHRVMPCGWQICSPRLYFVIFTFAYWFLSLFVKRIAEPFFCSSDEFSILRWGFYCLEDFSLSKRLISRFASTSRS